MEKEFSRVELEKIARKQNNVIEQLYEYIFMNQNIKEEEREFILANLNTVIRLI